MNRWSNKTRYERFTKADNINSDNRSRVMYPELPMQGRGYGKGKYLYQFSWEKVQVESLEKTRT